MFAAVSKRGFTLIELLVVITIIGILATGSVAVYTSQIQKARDTNRMNDMKAIESGVEQFYQDNSYYPDAQTASAGASLTGITVYVPQLPKDPKSGEVCNKGTLTNATACDYLYNVSADANGIVNGEYKISIGLENNANVSSKAAKDLGPATEVNRFEIGLNLSNGKSTVCDRTGKITGPRSGNSANATYCPTGTPGANAVFVAGN